MHGFMNQIMVEAQQREQQAQAFIGQMNAMLGGRLQQHQGHQQFQQQHQQAPHHHLGGDNSNVVDPLVTVAADVALGLGDTAVATSCCVLS